ncbi:MAG: ABC transporter transmembrane domain-containing protein, partial [Rhizomicrobium sp.]
MGMADRLGFSARAVRLELDSLDKLALPAILHWDLNHFVVLTKVGKGRVTVHDPAVGARVFTAGELSKHFTGVALELTPAATFAPVHLREPMRISQLWSSLHGMTGVLVQVFVLSAILQVSAFAAPFQLQLVVDDAIYQSDHDLLTVIALGFGGLVLLQVAIQYLRDRTLLIAGSIMGYQVVGNLLRHLMRLPSAFFEKRHLGDVLSRIRSSEPIRDAVTKGAVGAVVDGGMALFAAALLFLYAPVLAAIVLFTVALYLGVMLAAFPALRGRSREQIVASAKEQTTLMETLRAAVTIKLMGREAEREAVWRNLYAGVINTGLSIGTLQITTGALQATLMGLQTVAVVYIGGGMVIDGTGFSVGMLIAFLSFRQTFSDRMTSFIGQIVQFRLLGLHLDRLGDIVNCGARCAERRRARIRRSGRHRDARCCVPLWHVRSSGHPGLQRAHTARCFRRHHRQFGLRQEHAPEAAARPASAGQGRDIARRPCGIARNLASVAGRHRRRRTGRPVVVRQHCGQYRFLRFRFADGARARRREGGANPR